MKMNENQNQEYFRQTFDEVYAPEGLYGKVLNLNMEKKKFATRNVIRAAVCVFAVSAGMFAAAEGICYAATGESVVKKIKVEIDGEDKELKWSDDGKMRTAKLKFRAETAKNLKFRFRTQSRTTWISL